MRVVIVGPVYPYKGGIAHYTGLLAKSMAKKHETMLLSYKLQYPKLLYKRPQKDYENDSFRFENSEFLLNTINPFSAGKTAGRIREINPDLVIFQWWHPYFAPTCYLLLKSLKRKFKVIFLCHNVLPHEKFPLQKMLTKAVLKRADAYIVHSKKDAGDLKNLINNPVYKITAHPTYDAFNIEQVSRDNARQSLGIGDTCNVLLFFGYIREYKGLKHLLRAMPSVLSAHPDTLLLIAGDFFENNKDEYIKLIESTGCGNNIRIYDGYTPDKEVGKYFSACDLVVCPYESATQSGIVQIAYGFEKPVIATNAGGLPEVVADGETGYLVPPCDSAALGNAVIRFISSAQSDKQRMSENIRREADKYSWDRLVEIIEGWYNTGSRE